MIRSMLILFVCLFIGECVKHFAGLPIPGSVVGMILLTIALALRIIRLKHVKPAADVLTRNLGFFFVPPGVGLMLYVGLLKDEFVAIAGATIMSLVIVLVVVGRLQQALERRDG
jgi:holin-like protein